MNYIKQLQEQVHNLEADKKRIEEKLADLRRYFESPKFQCGDTLDGYVNIQDVLNRLP